MQQDIYIFIYKDNVDFLSGKEFLYLFFSSLRLFMQQSSSFARDKLPVWKLSLSK